MARRALKGRDSAARVFIDSRLSQENPQGDQDIVREDIDADPYGIVEEAQLKAS